MHVPEAGDVRARPVDRADRTAHVGAEAHEPADPERRGICAARPLLTRPVRLDVVGRLERRGSDELGEALEDELAASVRVQPPGELGLLPGEERAEDAHRG